MNRSEEAVKTFQDNYNCAQSVLSAFGPELGMDKGTCMKISAPFGGGMGKTQNVCGAVTGAIMVLGLKYGKEKNISSEDKKSTYTFANEFIQQFRHQFGSIDCIDILGANMQTEEGQKAIHQYELYKKKCIPAVKCAAEILEGILSEKG